MMIVTLFAVLALACSPQAAPPQAAPTRADLATLFDALDAALRASDAAAFARGWDPAGYGTNLVGGSGLPGERVFEQGARKGWVLKPDLDKTEQAGRDDLTIIPCAIWSWKRDQAVDHVHALVIRAKEGRLVILGAGEDPAEVRALAARVIAGQPLAPPQRDQP